MDRTIEEMTKTERRKVLASVGAFTIGNSVSTRPKTVSTATKVFLGYAQPGRTPCSP